MFRQLNVVDQVILSDEVRGELKKFSKRKVNFAQEKPRSEKKLLENIGEADGILVSWGTTISKKIMEKSPNLKYIGICGTNLKNIDLEEAKNRGIKVANVYDYADEATAEYVFFQIMNLFRNRERYRFDEFPRELFEKSIGIVGLGKVGENVARLAKGFGMKIYYNSRTRKPELEKSMGLNYLSLEKLIEKSDIVTLHVPKNEVVMGEKEFGMMTEGKVLIYTCLGKVFSSEKVFVDWISKGKNFAIIDGSISKDYYTEFRKLENVIFHNVIAADTRESRERLGQKVIKNIEKFLK